MTIDQQVREVACGALRVERCMPSRDLQLAGMVWLLGQITGMTNCATIKAGAESLSCLDRQELLPAVVYQLMQISFMGKPGPPGLPGQPGVPGPVVAYYGAYGGNAPAFTPSVPTPNAMVISRDTDSGLLWYYVSGAWTL
jgi:hypothetical protein